RLRRSAKRDGLPLRCRRCPVRFACQGECPRNRFTATPEGEAGRNYLCAGYLSFFTHIGGPMRLMADLIRSGRYADEIMDLFWQLRPCSGRTPILRMS
ncbi:MAG TPA: hypothetical protein VLX59_06515, partial [Acidimicrobiales bacterium]|nr:hypothetical protein [Acidimicrobiales bacterium]